MIFVNNKKLKNLQLDAYYNANDTYKKTNCHVAKSTHNITLRGYQHESIL